MRSVFRGGLRPASGKRARALVFIQFLGKQDHRPQADPAYPGAVITPVRGVTNDALSNSPLGRQHMERTFEQTVSDLRMLLRDQRPSTTADVTDGAVVYLAGGELRGALLCADDPNGLDERFDVDP